MASAFAEDEQRGLKETFALHDSDKDGQITVEELQTILQSLVIVRNSKQVQDVFKIYANQEKNTLSFDDFLSAFAILLETE
ncbi:hypothetical protein BGX34_002896 [Mortierella sp. NVP85]|nr:hypothetical protein BGX34_002896 [Mortierella sp. NVP85]